MPEREPDAASTAPDDRRPDPADRVVDAAPRERDALDDVRLTGLDEDGGTVIPGPQDRSDVENLLGGQHDAATGGSDLGATTGGGDTGAV